jgi:subtilisin family serine protease
LAYDLDSRITTGNLYPLNSEQSQRYAVVKKLLKGDSDLGANVDSAEAAELRQILARLKPEELMPFTDELRFFSYYAHGTHVAGLLTAGNPYARVATARMTWDWKTIPNPCYSKESVERGVAANREFIDFFKRNRVRVVNMSWSYTVKDFADRLERCGIGKDIGERQKIAREYFHSGKDALLAAMNSAPEILFVSSGGNRNSDSSFEDAVPAGLKLPNLLTVGAVDQAGDETYFTSYGPTVVVHAVGFAVESYIPGGDRLKMSGTSMSSPNAANLAAKILTVNPRLSPAEVISIIRTTADKTADGRRNLINPIKAIAAASTPATGAAKP